jgi:L-ribulokinase
MAEHGVSIQRVINGGGIPQKNETLNRIYANVLNKPVLVPESEVTSLGSAIFAFVAAGVFDTYEQAQDSLCPSYRRIEPDPAAAKVYDRLFELYRKLYFGLGKQGSEPVQIGEVLPQLRKIAAEVRG